jgi:hypothetical protein
MRYAVDISPTAKRQLLAAEEWYSSRDLNLGEQWLNGIAKAIDSLAVNPERFGLAHENDVLPVGLREMLFGVGRRKTHRVLFVIRENRVVIHQIRHVAQRDFMNDE